MPADRDDPDARRSVVPGAAARSVWLAAVWTGAGAALVGMVVSIVAVAVCWLPAAGASGSAGSAVRAGALTFLAALHAGITVDGVATAFVPLGMTLLVGTLAWRAGSGLADAVADTDERDVARLVRAGGLQAVSFAIVCAVAAAASTLGTSSVSVAGPASAALVLFGVTGGVAYVRGTALRDEVAERIPDWLAPAGRAAAVATCVYLMSGATLVAVSLVLHHDRVEALSAQVGGGWSGVPVLLLGVLAAPNGAIAGAGYLAGPGFAVGSGSTVGLLSAPHGTVPAFPVLGALPSGPAPLAVWLVAVVTPLAAGSYVAGLARRADTWSQRWLDAGRAAAAAGLIGVVLAWQGGGAIGSGRLNAVGASPWQFGLAVTGGVAVVAAAALGIVQGVETVRTRRAADERPAVTLRAVLTTIKDTGRVEPDDEQGSEPDVAHDEAEQGEAEADESAAETGDAQGDGKLAG